MQNRVLALMFLLITQYTYSEFLEFPLKKYLQQNTSIPSNASQRLSSAPYLSGDTFRSFGNFVIDKTNRFINPADIENGDVIFIAAHKEFLDFFFQNVHPKIKAYYILITHNTDKSEFNDYLKYLDDNNIMAWFGSNLTLEHKKTFPIPIGLANKYWHHYRGFNGNTQIIEKALKSATKKRDILMYMNFNPDTNQKSRGSVLNFFLNKKFCFNSNRVPFSYYISKLAQSKFVASPPGNGIDCHRTWEALYVDAIPIVSSTKLDRMYKDLPVLIVDDWNKITEDFLNAKYKEIKSKSYKLQKLTADYWLEKISKFKEKAKFEQNITRDKNFSQKPKIPKIIHQICLNNNGEKPDKYKKFQKNWSKIHPEWEYRFWSEKEINKLELENRKLYDETNNYSIKYDIAKYEILHRFGGLYIDPEFECLKKFDILHHYCDFYTGICFKNIKTTISLIGTSTKNPKMKKYIKNIKQKKHKKENSIKITNQTQPPCFTKCFFVTTNTCNDTAIIFPTTYFP